jgi:hypothetical protein
MNKLPYEINVEVLKKIKNIDDLRNFCLINKRNHKLCKDNFTLISKNLLKYYQVDYTDPTNLIYVYNEKHIDDYKSNDDYSKNDKYDYKSIFKLYMKLYNLDNIKIKDSEITSVPILPNMIYFDGENNNLVSFPIQPKMKIFNGSSNKLTSFPIQPKMKEFWGKNNQLVSFPIQPEMELFYGDEYISSILPIQPKLELFNGELI